MRPPQGGDGGLGGDQAMAVLTTWAEQNMLCGLARMFGARMCVAGVDRVKVEPGRVSFGVSHLVGKLPRTREEGWEVKEFKFRPRAEVGALWAEGGTSPHVSMTFEKRVEYPPEAPRLLRMMEEVVCTLEDGEVVCRRGSEWLEFGARGRRPRELPKIGL